LLVWVLGAPRPPTTLADGSQPLLSPHWSQDPPICYSRDVTGEHE
jgi:hypothetical protein